MFVLSVAVLTFNYMAATGGNLQHELNLYHPASAPSSAILSSPEKLETDDSYPIFRKRTSDFGMPWDIVATF